MKDHTGCKRSFVWTTRAYYAKSEFGTCCVDRITFGMYADDDSTTGEMEMRWEIFGNDAVPVLRAYDDAWDVLASFGDLLQEMAKVDDKNITPSDFVEILLSCGFEDATQYNERGKNEN